MIKAKGVSIVVLGQDCGLAPDQSISAKELRAVAEVFSLAAEILEKATKHPHGVIRYSPRRGELTEIGFDDDRTDWDMDKGLPLLREVR